MSDERDNSIDIWMLDISEKMGTVVEGQKSLEETSHRIEENTIKTNGRVNKLENWRNYLAGAIAVIGFAITIYAELHH